ncbi:MAG: C69 family dipeptidase, partial [Erysipelotrichales bacterium]|nr:C69 family dipeptidase [Erysipelotrichales bacterium]
DADFTPESDNIPWSFVPERKITVEDVKYILSSYYQGTPYNPYNPGNDPEKGKYRSIGIGRTGVTAILQVRGYMPKEIQAVEWITFGSNAFNTAIPFYTNTGRMPKYVKDVTTDVSTENFFWASRLIGALADPYFPVTAQMIERYQEGTANESHRLLSEYDRKMTENNDFSLMEKANEDLAEMAQKESVRCLNQVLNYACRNMRNNYSRKDH